MRNSDMVLAFLSVSVRLNTLGVKVLQVIDNDNIKLEMPDGEERIFTMNEAWGTLSEMLDNDDHPENIG